MVLHLVHDVLWRQRLVNLSMIVPVTAWAGISGGYLDVSYGLTFTLFFALIAGPGAAMLALSLREIRVLPIAERTELFARAAGETSDIVEKQMYTFGDLDGASLTAAVRQALIELAHYVGRRDH